MVGRLTLDQLVVVRIHHPQPFSWRISLAVRTPPSQGGSTGSSPVCATKFKNQAGFTVGFFVLHEIWGR